MEIITTEELPVEASMSGKNTCYLSCKPLNKRSHYGVCLFTLKKVEDGTIKGFDDCQSAIRKGGCSAASYRAKEEEAGRALYFQERTPAEPSSRPAAAPKPIKSGIWNTSSRKPSTSPFKSMSGLDSETKAEAKPTPVKKKKPKTILSDAPTLSDAVSAVAKEQSEKSKKGSGLSLLERAKAMRAGTNK